MSSRQHATVVEREAVERYVLQRGREARAAVAAHNAADRRRVAEHRFTEHTADLEAAREALKDELVARDQLKARIRAWDAGAQPRRSYPYPPLTLQHLHAQLTIAEKEIARLQAYIAALYNGPLRAGHLRTSTRWKH